MEKILIISCNALGDTYLSAGALEALRGFAPSIEIHFIAQRNSIFFLQKLPIDKIFLLVSKKIIDIFKLINSIRKNKYDIVFTFFPGLVNSIFFYFTKSQIRIGFPNFIRRNQWYNISQKVIIKGISNQEFEWQPEMNYMLRISKLLELAGIDKKYVAKPIFNNIKPLGNHFSEGITIHYKATDNERSISNDDLIKFCTALLNKGIERITLVGTELDFDSHIIQFCEKNNVNIIMNPSLQELLNLILEVKVFIGVDSFPLHIADAYNTNFLGIFGPTFPSSVLVNPSKSIKFGYGNYIYIDITLLIERITKIYEKV